MEKEDIPGYTLIGFILIMVGIGGILTIIDLYHLLNWLFFRN